MIFGDPDGFAVYWEELAEWSTNTFKNGLIGVVCGGEVVGGRILRATLGPEVLRLKQTLLLLQRQTDTVPSSWDASAIYAHAIEQLSRIDHWEMRDVTLLSPWALVDAGQFVFFVINDNQTERVVFFARNGGGEDVIVAKGSVASAIQGLIDQLS